MGLDLFGLFQKTARLGDGYDGRNPDGTPFSFTEKETFSGVTILTASEVGFALIEPFGPQYGRPGFLIVSAMDSGLNGPGSSPG